MSYKEIINNLDKKQNRQTRIGEFLKEFRFKNINCIEIGGGNGDTTKEIAKYASKLLVIDPFTYNNGADNSYIDPYPVEIFLNNTKGFDNVRLHKETSLHKSSKEEILKMKPIFFAFLDGLQYKEIVLKELEMFALMDTEIICVDDINRITSISEVPLAVREFLKTNKKYELVDIGVQEGYLIKI